MPDGETVNVPVSKNGYRDKEELRRLYIEEKYNQTEISEIYDVSQRTISKWCRKFGFDTESRRAEQISTTAAGMYTNKNGYETWAVRNEGEMRVHRLSAIAEYGTAAVEGKHVHHKNGIPWDNRPENIEPVDPSEHNALHHKRGDFNYQFGENNPQSKLSEQEVRKIRLAASWGIPAKEIAVEYDVTKNHINRILRGERW